MERQEKREKELLPVRRIEPVRKREQPKEPPQPQDVTDRDIPRRWKIF